MRRREFIAGLGSAVGWPLAARAQQPDRMRRIGVLELFASGDPEGRTDLSELRRGLTEHGWIEGRTIEIAVRWPGGNIELIESLAKE